MHMGKKRKLRKHLYHFCNTRVLQILTTQPNTYCKRAANNTI